MDSPDTPVDLPIRLPSGNDVQDTESVHGTIQESVQESVQTSPVSPDENGNSETASPPNPESTQTNGEDDNEMTAIVDLMGPKKKKRSKKKPKSKRGRVRSLTAYQLALANILAPTEQAYWLRGILRRRTHDSRAI